MYLIAYTTYKQWAVPWVQYVLHPMQRCLWQILKQNTAIHTLKRCLCYSLDILTTYVIWDGSKAELMTFIKDLNEKHKTIKFDFQVSPRKIAFLDAMLYKDENNNIQTTLYRKPTDQQAFLHAKSEHPRSLKRSIPYSQALRLKTICSTSTEFDKNCAIIKQKFLDRQYKEEVLDEQSKKADRIERKELFTCKEKTTTKTEPHYQ